MGFMDDFIERLKAVDRSTEPWGDLVRVRPDAEPALDDAIRWFVALNDEPADELPEDVKQGARQHLAEVANAADSVANLQFGSPQFAQEVANVVYIFQSAGNWWRTTARPHLLAGAVELRSQASAARAEVDRAKGFADEIESMAEALKELTATAGTLELATHYGRQATSHRTAANRWIFAVAAFAVAVVVLGWVLFKNSGAAGAADDWLEFAHGALVKAFVVGALSYGIAFSAKAYRTNAHLAAVYDQKAVALKTYPLFSASVDDGEARAVILAELVRSVFTAADTGVLDGGGGDHTIIESSLPLVTALTKPK